MRNSGLLGVYKPEKMTSFDVIAILRKKLGIKRIGHLGTLDPMATGVLPVALGKSARIMEYLDGDQKKYICTLKLGVLTDTLDIWGKEEQTSDVPTLTEEEVRSTLEGFVGVSGQVPPMYSAIKKDGKKLYEYARKGEVLDLPKREIYVRDIELLSFDSPYLSFAVTCSKGTYIRSMCRDIGEALGTVATMTALERVESGYFTVENSVSVEALREMDCENIEALLIGSDAPLSHFGKAVISGDFERKLFVNGVTMRTEQVEIIEEPLYRASTYALSLPEYYKNAFRVYDEHGDFLGVGIASEDGMKADKVFYE